MSRRGRKLSLRDLASEEIFMLDEECEERTRPGRDGSYLSGSSTDDETSDGSQCPVCYEDLDEANLAALKRDCGHKFCLTCILRWSRVKTSCPLCQTRYGFITSYYLPDGTFKDDPIEIPVEFMTRITWLDLEFIASPTASPRPPRDERMVVEEDLYGIYNWDGFDDEFDLRNFAPSRGKDGRRRKSEAGCVSVTAVSRSYAEKQGPNQQCRRPPEPHHQRAISAPNIYADASDTAVQANMHLKLGRRARRTLMRRLADEKAGVEC